MKHFFTWPAAALATAVLTGCATSAQLSPQQLAQNYPAVSTLADQVKAADQKSLPILAPNGYAKAVDALEGARTAAERGQTDNANTLASVGLKALGKAEADAEHSARILSEVLEARRRARAAGANTLFNTELADLEAQAAELGDLIESGNLEKAKKGRPELQQAYLDLELRALKEGTVRLARAALDSARKNGAEKYAPKTYQAAAEELVLAQQVLDGDRTRQDKANAHANRARVLADKAANITGLIKDFDRRKYSEEDIVLWYQENLKTAVAPLGSDIHFGEANQLTITAIRTDLSNVMASLQDKDEKIVNLSREMATLTALREQELQSLRQHYESNMTNVKQQIAQKETIQAQAARLDAEEKARFDKVQSLFGNKEAQVYQQRKNVLISAHGFAFPPGQSKIDTENFALLNKIATAITQFKGATVYISGHTDATGSAQVNKSLSEERANSVKQFLTEVAGIPAERIVTQGYGKDRPVASNDTAQGRALNRRIDVLILNEPRE